MQSTGQGGTHRSHPVHSSGITACNRFGAPAIASTGQAWMHFVQPMHSSATIRAMRRGPSTPQEGSSGRGSRPVSRASSAMPALPPGGQRLIGAPSWTIARAYGRQPPWPHWVHWVWGSSASTASTRGSSRDGGAAGAAGEAGAATGLRRARG